MVVLLYKNRVMPIIVYTKYAVSTQLFLHLDLKHNFSTTIMAATMTLMNTATITMPAILMMTTIISTTMMIQPQQQEITMNFNKII